jgi:hypothetical protein
MWRATQSIAQSSSHEVAAVRWTLQKERGAPWRSSSRSPRSLIASHCCGFTRCVSRNSRGRDRDRRFRVSREPRSERVFRHMTRHVTLHMTLGLHCCDHESALCNALVSERRPGRRPRLRDPAADGESPRNRRLLGPSQGSPILLETRTAQREDRGSGRRPFPGPLFLACSSPFSLSPRMEVQGREDRGPPEKRTPEMPGALDMGSWSWGLPAVGGVGGRCRGWGGL